MKKCELGTMAEEEKWMDNYGAYVWWIALKTQLRKKIIIEKRFERGKF